MNDKTTETTQVDSLPSQMLPSNNDSAFSSMAKFEEAQRLVKPLVQSSLVPEAYRNNVGNAMIALEMANRIGASPLAVMQNLHVIQGRPSFSSTFIIAALNSCGTFSPLRYELEELGSKEVEYTAWTGPKGNRNKTINKQPVDDVRCRAWATELETGEKLIGPWVSMEMAIKEGWFNKNDSKWQTMPDLMIRYRAAAFFGRLYAPHILMGMHAEEEVRDVQPTRDITPKAAPAQTGDATVDSLNAEIIDVDATVVESETAEPENQQGDDDGLFEV